ncbi:MAG: DUF1345 domain-containing protein [Chitinophagaceae bacterium]|nr:DUF1345 domain-containing protein [Chitinophagaceae bacterium]
MVEKKLNNPHNAFERLHAIHKIIICFALAIAVYLLTDVKKINWLSHIMIGWDTFSFTMLIMTWITFKITTPTEIRKQAGVQDASRVVIFIIILISAIASFLAVLILLIYKNPSTEAFDFPIAIAGMLFSWFLVHTIFAMRYAHLYYGDHETKPDVPAGGLDFPGDQKPGYLDFAYFSFVLGMTFQVSDVQVTSKRLRKLALLHGILSFGFNTVIVALTINVIAGLKK